MEALLGGPRQDTTVTVPRELWKRARKRAIDEDTTANMIVTRALYAYLSSGDAAQVAQGEDEP